MDKTVIILLIILVVVLGIFAITIMGGDGGATGSTIASSYPTSQYSGGGCKI
ncbi:MAG: hypothetical protein QF567_02055 [Candidatus Pacearchaeota archaeon]|jgi:hypothetical protein|nr:hypothetical protein [Candidatus Pacearchaeota archaeon]|tara:strand:+ start:453 stop:608 length:156 start_codon:yes stop_codon:yes gene_type:complete